MKQTTLIPVVKEVLDDINTPVSAYLKLDQPNSFLLESVIGGDSVARYSFIGLDPICTFLAEDDTITVTRGDVVEKLTGNPVDILESMVASFNLKDSDELPPFVGGAVGFFSWEVIGAVESIKFAQKTGVDFPKSQFIFPRSVLVFDHAERKVIVVSLAEPGEEQDAAHRIDEIKNMLMKPMQFPIFDKYDLSDVDVFQGVESNYEKEDFISHVEKVKQNIYEGDVFQLVLSQKFSLKSDSHPFDVYRKLRSINPSPYMYYFNFGDYQIVGSSPEILSRCQNGRATLRPIAGTRLRTGGDETALIEDLKSDEKEKAEHIMLVDLGRNDLGRVCEYNSVETSDLMTVEKYSHVLHMVSNVEGTLKEGCNAFDLFRATFPAGTLSGAPKVRAIEIIESMEPERRGPYGGALGYFDFRGNMDLCIIIRTLMHRDGLFQIQAGAGIVADSDPEKEYQESRNKARGMLAACYKRKSVLSTDD
ncbi:anthranilate synthase component I [bacterium]|jgi:anthranilate synthase component I|nr:anthranilate synthase component I [bacterium]